MAKVVLLNKPYGVLSQFRDAQQRSTVAQFVSDPTLRIAGRLDRDSEGLLVLTDDGVLANKITQPAAAASQTKARQGGKAFSKCYWIQVEASV